MVKKIGLFAGCLGFTWVVFVTGCARRAAEETVSVIDENQFDELASVSGSAAGEVEILADGTRAQGRAGNPQAVVAVENVPQAGAVSATVILPPIQPSAGLNTFEHKVQIALRNAGFYSGDIDGKIGSKTREAIKAFQTANGLKSDGVVGPSTWDKLKQYI